MPGLFNGSKNVKAISARSGFKHKTSLAYTLVEVMIGVAIMSTGLASLCLGFSQGFTVIQVARENLRATQILQEKMETIRLFTWNQLTNAPAMTAFTGTRFRRGAEAVPLRGERGIR